MLDMDSNQWIVKTMNNKIKIKLTEDLEFIIAYDNKEIKLKISKGVIQRDDEKILIFAFNEAKWSLLRKIKDDDEIITNAEEILLNHAINGMILGIIYANRVISAPNEGETSK